MISIIKVDIIIIDSDRWCINERRRHKLMKVRALNVSEKINRQMYGDCLYLSTGVTTFHLLKSHLMDFGEDNHRST